MSPLYSNIIVEQSFLSESKQIFFIKSENGDCLTHTHNTAGGGNSREAFNTGGKGRGGNSDHRELHLDSGV